MNVDIPSPGKLIGYSNVEAIFEWILCGWMAMMGLILLLGIIVIVLEPFIEVRND